VEIAHGWGVRADLVPDLSEAMPPAPAQAGIGLLERAGVDLRRPTVGLALTAIRPELWRAVRSAVQRAMDAMPDAEFCFVPMSRHPSVPSHDDVRAALEIRNTRPRLRIVEEVVHPATILSAIGALDAVVAMRFHAMLFAERAGTPMVAIPYAEKNRRWLSERGHPAVEPASDRLETALRDAIEARERRHEPMLTAS
jgi:polysaccharide pyruvyl transferase WcaK-like protein